MRLLADHAMVTRFRAGETIFRTGETGHRFLSYPERPCGGGIPRIRPGPELIQTVGAGEVLGWSWLFPPYTWNC